MPTTVRVPPLHDRHSHASLYAAFLGCPSLAGTDSHGALDVLRRLDPERLSVAFGWHSARAPLAEADLRDLPPVVIVNVSLHGFVLTAAAAGTLADTQPGLVRHGHDARWIEGHLPQVLEFFGRTAGLTPQKLETFMDRVAKVGLAAVDDMLLPDESALHVIRQSRWGAHVACWATPQTISACSPASQQMVAGLKFFTDGAFGTWTAALRGSYRDGRRGLLLYSDDTLLQALADAHGFRKPVAIHAIGDRAIEQVLTTVERLDRDGVRFPGIRLEHAQLIDRAQAERARDLGIVLSMQPNFNSDSRDYADRLDESVLAANNPFRMLIDQVGFTPGRDLIFGSDGMPHGIEYALQWSLFPAYPGQRLSVDELVAGYGVHPGGGNETELDVDDVSRRVTLADAEIPIPRL